MSKYTPGPLKVSIWPKWPFYIDTFDQSGELVFRREMPMYSTKQKTAEEAMAGTHMDKYADQACKANARALADEVLRALAPELLTMVARLTNSLPLKADMHAAGWEQCEIDEALDAQSAAHALIAKATGTA